MKGFLSTGQLRPSDYLDHGEIEKNPHPPWRRSPKNEQAAAEQQECPASPLAGAHWCPQPLEPRPALPEALQNEIQMLIALDPLVNIRLYRKRRRQASRESPKQSEALPRKKTKTPTQFSDNVYCPSLSSNISYESSKRDGLLTCLLPRAQRGGSS